MDQTRKITGDLPEPTPEQKKIKLNPPDSKGHARHKCKRANHKAQTTLCDRMTIGGQEWSQLPVRKVVDRYGH